MRTFLSTNLISPTQEEHSGVMTHCGWNVFCKSHFFFIKRAGDKPTMSFFLKGNFISCVSEYFPCMQVCVPITRLMPVEARKELKSLEIGVINSCEPRNQTQVLQKSSQNFSPLGHLSSLSMVSVLPFKTEHCFPPRLLL